MNSPGWQVPNVLLEISAEITPKKNEETEPKQKQQPFVDVTDDGSKVRCCKEQYYISSVQFSTVAQSCPTLCDPMNRSTPGLPVHHQLPEFTDSHPSSQ